MVPQKHKEAAKFRYNSGFYITTNTYPDFGSGSDGVAIRKRLAVFDTKPLPRKDNKSTGKHFLSVIPHQKQQSFWRKVLKILHY